MGTSTSQPSPDTRNWRLARSVLGSQTASPERQSAEIWRAAVSDRGERLLNALASPLLAKAAQIAQAGLDPAKAIDAFDHLLQRAHAAGLSLEVGRVALGRATAVSSGSTGFAGELFAETASYYVSRDLPGYIGAEGRVTSSGEAIALKNRIRTIARETATTIPGGVPQDETAWRGYVGQVLEKLQRGTRG